MQTPSYQRNAQKAAQAERNKDYPMAVVFWGKAASKASSDADRHWADCRREHCKKHSEEWLCTILNC